MSLYIQNRTRKWEIDKPLGLLCMWCILAVALPNSLLSICLCLSNNELYFNKILFYTVSFFYIPTILSVYYRRPKILFLSKKKNIDICKLGLFSVQR